MRIEQLFSEWLNSQYPDGMGEGFGGSYSQDDLRNAFAAGYERGAQDT